MRPDLTVIVPFYNAARTLETTLHSLTSSFSFRLLGVNDGSTDESALLFIEWSKNKPWVELITVDQNGGLGAARNTGLAATVTPYVAFLDADDQWIATTGQALQKAMRSPSPWMWAPIKEVHQNGMRRTRATDVPHTPEALVTGRSPFVPSACVWHTETLRDLGGWDTDPLGVEDLGLWIRAMAAGLRAQPWSTHPQIEYSVTSDGLSGALEKHADKIRYVWQTYTQQGLLAIDCLPAAERELQRQMARTYHKSTRFDLAIQAYKKSSQNTKNKLLRWLAWMHWVV